MASGSQSPKPGQQQQATPAGATLTTAGGYGLLLALGLLQGLTGSLQYSRGIGPVPLAAIAFAIAIGLTCTLCGRGMGSTWGAIAPAAGWLLASFAMAMPQKSGTVVITNSAAGELYLVGGALCAAIGIGVGLSGWGRARAG